MFDPETVILLGKVVDRVWDHLPRDLRSLEARRAIASAILPLAAEGQRDEARLCDYALTVVPALLEAQQSFGLGRRAESGKRADAQSPRRSNVVFGIHWVRELDRPDNQNRAPG